MVGKELRLMRRDPRFRSQAAGLAVALAALGLGAGRFLIGTEYAPFLAVVVAWMAATATGFNQFGLDDRSFWAYLVSGVDMKLVLKGKNLAVALIGMPVLVVAAAVTAGLVGDVRHLPSAILAGGAVLTLWLAVGNVVSILGGYPLPESNLFGNRNVSGSILLASLGGLLAAGALSTPLAALVVLPLALGGAGAGLLGALAALGAALMIYRLSLRVAGGLLESRALRLLEVLDKPQV
jgi:ABC-2 type transport system permease protein